jgi:hypothetical protein
MESSCDHSNLMERCEPVSSKACNTGDHRSTPPATKRVLMNLKHWHECDFTWFLMMSSAGQRNWLERNWKLGVIHFCCRILLLSIFCCSETWALSALFLQSSHLPSWVYIVSTVTFDDSCPAIWFLPQASMVIKRTVQAGASSVAAPAQIMTWVFSFHALPGLLLETCKIIT